MKRLKPAFDAIFNALGGCLVPLIPVLITAALFKTLNAILGPDMLSVLSGTSDLYRLFAFVGDAGFYFLPVYCGYTAAKTFDCSRILGLFLGAILVHPSLLELAGTPFTVYFLPAPIQNYSGSILPAILSVWILSYVEKGVDKIMPKVLVPVFSPFLCILIMLPVTLCLVGPMGAIAGVSLVDFVLWMGSHGKTGILLTLLMVGAFWQFIVMVGMHWLFIAAILTLTANGQVDAILFPAATASSWAVGGICLGVFLRTRSAEALSALVAQAIGGVTEPGLYGVGFQYRKSLIGLMAGGAAGALYAGLTGVVCTNLVPVASFLQFLSFSQGTAANFVNAVIAGIISFGTAAILSFLLVKKQSAQ